MPAQGAAQGVICTNGGAGAQHDTEAPVIPTLTLRSKKKYRTTASYLHDVLCQVPRRYTYNAGGKQRLLKYFTLPFRLSMTRFMSNKIIKGYYGGRHSRYRALFRKGNSAALRRGALRQSAQNQSASGEERLKGAEALLPNRIPKTPRLLPSREKNEVARAFALAMEERLDTSLLRALNFDPVYVSKKKYAHPPRSTGTQRFGGSAS
jgi:hypothetical protein